MFSISDQYKSILQFVCEESRIAPTTEWTVFVQNQKATGVVIHSRGAAWKVTIHSTITDYRITFNKGRVNTLRTLSGLSHLRIFIRDVFANIGDRYWSPALETPTYKRHYSYYSEPYMSIMEALSDTHGNVPTSYNSELRDFLYPLRSEVFTDWAQHLSCCVYLHEIAEKDDSK